MPDDTMPTAEEAALLEVCFPVHVCFPPRPTYCAWCHNITRAECPFDKDKEAQDARRH